MKGKDVMKFQSRAGQGLLAFLLLVAGPSIAQDDSATDNAPITRNSDSSDSPAGADRSRETEAPISARPGLYFFNKGAKAFKKSQYTFAIEMYETSASYAYKPAQYNLSIIYAKGQGVAVDLPRALAWATLAAERSDEHYAAARNAIHAAMSPEQLDEADIVLTSLIPKYADQTAMKRARSRWRDAKLAATGSHLGFVGGLKLGDPGKAHGSSQTTEVGDMESAGVSATSWDVIGDNPVDASLVYRQLQQSDNPYDPRFRERTGTVTVGELDANPKAPISTATDPDKH
jgi:hypothetical protein